MTQHSIEHANIYQIAQIDSANMISQQTHNVINTLWSRQTWFWRNNYVFIMFLFAGKCCVF